MRLLTVFGTRPEAIKMAPVVRVLREAPGVTARVCVTGQHRAMLDSVLDTFALRPDDDLDVMRPDQGLSDVFGRVLMGVDAVIREFRPDCVLVQGDTATSTAAALAAFFQRVPVGHVEAGLRTGDLASPWPEEANRRVTAVIAARHYAPTTRARDALLREGHAPECVILTGNTVIDALLHTAEEVTKPGLRRDALAAEFSWLDPGKRLILVTGHRRESFGEGFSQICRALTRIARRDDVQIVYPVHLNPNVRRPVFKALGHLPNVTLIEPLDYPRFVYLMTRSWLILTDSGGIQEEAPALKKPVLVMRDTSERLEAVKAGVAKLVTTDPDRIVKGVDELLDRPDIYAAMSSGASPFGDGQASRRILEDLLSCHRTFEPSPSLASAMSASPPPQPSPLAALT